jgi:hypothetical protein
VTALMTREQVTAAHKAALERKKRDRENVYKSYTVAEERQAWLEGRELERISIYSAPYRDPATLAEWLDDRVLEWGQRLMRDRPEAALMVAVAEAARESTAAAARALKAARELTAAEAWAVYQNLDGWPALDPTRRLGADLLGAALTAEWRRLKLPTEDPAADTAAGETADRRRRRRRWGAIETEAAS